MMNTFAAYRLMKPVLPYYSCKKKHLKSNLDTHVDSSEWTLTRHQSAHT